MRTAFEALGGWGQVGNLSAGFETNDEHPNDGGERPRFRAVFISDLHLGTAGCQASALLEFLKHHPSQTLYLVGDIIDGWQLRRKWFWPQAHNDVVQKLLRRARKGCRVVFVPGNHDEFARRYVEHNFGGVDVVDDWIHETADGRKLWVVHGDLFDGVIQCARWLALLGDSLYEARLFVRGSVKSLGADCIEKEMRPEHLAILADLLKRGEADHLAKPEEFKRYGSARKLNNFNVDNASAY